MTEEQAFPVAMEVVRAEMTRIGSAMPPQVRDKTDLAIAMTRWLESHPDLPCRDVVIALSLLLGAILRGQPEQVALGAGLIVAVMKSPTANPNKDKPDATPKGPTLQ